MTHVPTYAPTAPGGSTRSPHQRVCFRLQVRPDRIEDYRAAHEDVWPDMLAALRASGWENYSLFLADDGLLIGYFEAASPASAREAMQHHEVNQRWQSAMSEYFDIDTAPDQGFVALTEVFNLDDRLDELGLDAPQTTVPPTTVPQTTSPQTTSLQTREQGQHAT